MTSIDGSIEFDDLALEHQDDSSMDNDLSGGDEDVNDSGYKASWL